MGVVSFDRGIGECEVMRRGFACHADPCPFSHPKEVDPHFRADMLDVDAPARETREENVPRDGDLLGRGRDGGNPETVGGPPLVRGPPLGQLVVLGVFHEKKIERLGVFEGTPEDQCAAHRPSVVRECDGPRFLELREVRHLFPFQPARDSRHGEYVCRPLGRRLLPDVPRHFRMVVHRVGVRHADDGGEPPRGGRGRSRPDVLFPLESGIAKVDVHVDQARENPFPGRVDHRAVKPLGSFPVGKEIRYLSVRNHDAPPFIPSRFGIDHSSFLNEQHCAPPREGKAAPFGWRRRTPPGSG